LYSNDWSVDYKSGELKAIGYNKGKQVATSKLRTTDVASKLQITSLPLPIASDIVLFEVAIADKNGLNVIDAKAAITVKVEGEGKLIGIDNGDLDYTGSFKTNIRNSYQGRLLVTVQRTAATGEIRITASAPGLSTAILQVK
jgi:beta-galactosidase